MIDSTPAGGRVLEVAVDLCLLTADYERNSSMNGMALCADCYISYFAPNLIALSPPAPVLDYICNYLIDTPTTDQKPLNQVFDLLRLSMTGSNVALPDPTPILPYLGLFTIVPLMLHELLDCTISTNHLPELSHLQDNQFAPAPHGTSPADQNVARIFDVLAIAAGNPPVSLGDIPLWLEHPQFQQQRYWRLPVRIEAVLAVLIEQADFGINKIPEINTAKAIGGIIKLQRLGLKVSKPSADDGPVPGVGPAGGGRSGGGPGGGGGGGDGPSARGRGGSGTRKRSLQSSDHAKPPSKKGRINICLSKVLGEPDIPKSRSGGPDESQLSDRSQRTHHGVNPDEWEVASSFSYDERLQTRSLVSENSITTRTLSGPDSEGGLDDPKSWRFGPSYRSDMIIDAALRGALALFQS